MFTDIFIGFQQPETTYLEVNGTYNVTLIKGAGNVTEQRIAVGVNLVQTVPLGSEFDVATTLSADGVNEIDITLNALVEHFPPDVNEITVPFTIFGDDLPENTEAAQLTLEVPTGNLIDSPPRFELLPEYPTFFIIIEDNDGELH